MSRPDALPARSILAGPIVAAATVLAALVVTNRAGVPFRDPDHVVGKRLALVGALVLLLVALDILVRAARRASGARPPRAAIAEVARERWTRRRALAVGGALVGFYVTYLAYRNLKANVPLLEPGVSYDHTLAGIDRGLLGGHNASDILHGLLGTGAATEILSAVYVSFIAFLPVSLAVALVFAPGLRGGVYYATALSLNWGLGALSYFLLPSMGPAFAAPERFAALPHTEVARLQSMMIDERREYVAHPLAVDHGQNIAAFASLHISMIFTAAMTAQLLAVPRALRVVLWLLFGLSALATVHLGWHYVVDDAAGLAIALLALAGARGLTGIDPRRARARATRPLGTAQPQPATR
jgi:hypothetical protein